MGVGQVALRGLPLRLFRYFDRVFEDFGAPWQAEPLRAPTLIPVGTLAKCDYFRSFPHIVTFATHLTEDHATIDGFRTRHTALDALDDGALRDMSQPEAGLSPAVCYHAYSLHAGREVPAGGLTYGMCGKCFATRPATCGTCAGSGISPCAKWFSLAHGMMCSRAARVPRR